MGDCHCEGPGWCDTYKQDMPGRFYEVCSGKCPPERPCPPPERVAKYKTKWRRQALWWGFLRVPHFLLAALRHTLNFCQNVPEAVYRKRVQACLTLGGDRPCASFRGSAEDPGCGRCGCRGLKWRWASERCPLEPPAWDVWKPAPVLVFAVAKVLLGRACQRVLEFANGGPLTEPPPKPVGCGGRKIVSAGGWAPPQPPPE